MKVKCFDIILVFFHVRKHDYYVHIIGALAAQYKIGLLLSDEKDFYATHRGHRRVMQTEKQFRKLCYELGAEKIIVDQKIHSKIVIMPVEGFYKDDYIDKFKANVSWDRLIGLFFFLSKTDGLQLIKELGAQKYFVPAKHIFEHILEEQNIRKDVEGVDIIEVGFPHKKYPIFNDSDIAIDYLVAYPSFTHFMDGRGREQYEFVSSLYSLLKKINDKERIYLKHHNNRDKQSYYVSKVMNNQYFAKFSIAIIDMLIMIWPFSKKFLYWCAIKLKNCYIQLKYPTVEELTEYHNFGAESFLPHVKKGLITGMSSTHLHALKNRLPVFCCDRQINETTTQKCHEAYLVPYCNEELVFDESHFDRIPEECRNADIVEILEKEVKEVESCLSG